MGKAGIAIGVIVFMVLVTMADMAWSTSWNAVAFMTNDPSWKSHGTKNDDLRFGTTFRHRIIVHDMDSRDHNVTAQFLVTNTTDHDITSMWITCHMVPEYSTMDTKFQFGDTLDHAANGEVVVPANSTVVLRDDRYAGNLSSDENFPDATCEAEYSAL